MIGFRVLFIFVDFFSYTEKGAALYKENKRIKKINRNKMEKHRIFTTSFASVYPHYINKALKKGRTKEEVHSIIFWLTGYDGKGLSDQIETKKDFETFFAEAPKMNPNVTKITGVICGYRVEEIENPLMQKIRYLDKLVDELAKGKSLEKIFRS